MKFSKEITEIWVTSQQTLLKKKSARSSKMRREYQNHQNYQKTKILGLNNKLNIDWKILTKLMRKLLIR
jgi:hypothetical protein